MALTEEDRTSLVGWLLAQIGDDERIARTLANRRGTGSRQATIQAATRRNTVRSFDWWLRHGSDALAAVTLGDLATIYADRPGYRDHCRALLQLAPRPASRRARPPAAPSGR